jgi:hypothetical protein
MGPRIRRDSSLRPERDIRQEPADNIADGPKPAQPGRNRQQTTPQRGAWYKVGSRNDKWSTTCALNGYKITAGHCKRLDLSSIRQAQDLHVAKDGYMS